MKRIIRLVWNLLAVLALTGSAFFILWWGLVVRLKHVAVADGAVITNKWSPKL